MKKKQAILICGHGSRDAEAVEQFQALSTRLSKRFPLESGYGFLEFARPTLSQTLDHLCAKGYEDILALPGMLFAAGHAKNDIPALLNAYQEKNAIRIRYGRPLELDAKMLYVARDRIQSAVDDFSQQALHQTLLVVVGRGASDPDANGNVSKLTRLLWECFGFGWAETAYSGVTFPLVKPALLQVAKLGFKRVVVFPYFLFTGVLIKRIYSAVDEVAAQHKEIDFIKAPYLNDHPLIEEIFTERLEEIEQGENMMNCQMCKYRTALPGFEAEKGLAQESHHHHVEGIGVGLTPHSNGHDPHHHHPPYPHSDHPLGSRTLNKK